MNETARSVGRHVLAALALVILAWVIFKIVLGIVATLVWILVAVVFLLAVVWVVVRVL